MKMCVLHLIKIDPRTKSEVQEVYSWDKSRKVSKSLLAKAHAIRFEVWVSAEEEAEMVAKGWVPALRSSDGSKIISSKGNVLLTFPRREALKPFPF